MYVLGLIFWLYDRPLASTIAFLEDYFAQQRNLPDVAQANVKVLKAGFHFGETVRMFTHRYQVAKASIPPGTYRRVTGNEAVALGLIAAAQLAGKSLIYCSYPITPASEILHYLAARKHFGVRTIQAEDEIAAVSAAIGAAFAGQIGCTGTSGPGLALKSEAMGLAVMTELPLVIVNVQRAGPSTGMPTKTEQADLNQALYGRSGESPLLVMAPFSPADCFATVLDGCRLALKHMTPAVILSDAYLANGAEPWRLPELSQLPPIAVRHPAAAAGAESAADFHPYQRNAFGARPWALPGTPGLEHRIGGLEKEDGTGNVSYDALNHQRMTELRAAKVQSIASELPATDLVGAKRGDLLVVGWGSTYGAILSAVQRLQEAGRQVSYLHLRYLNPLPRDLKEKLESFAQILVPELNSGQLCSLLRHRFLVDARGLNKVQGQPFLIEEIQQGIELMLAGRWGDRLAVGPHQFGELDA
jgi:2-oxoglutarate ferredoxin oxidoreductase subunit alpha